MLFEPNGRIEKNSNGIRFYEQDIIFSNYVFTGDVEVNIHVDYLHSGFGIVIAEKYKGGPRNTEKAHLFKLGNNAFQVIERTLLAQNTKKENACLFAPDIANINVNLIFSITGRNIKLQLKNVDAKTNAFKTEELGTYKLQKQLNEYYIGFYSNKGNIVRNVTFRQGAPNNWLVNINNTEGGRISFIEDGFKFEQCKHDAEIEQDNIELEAGTYYVAYDTETVDDKFDIDCCIFPSKLENAEDKYFEDDYKNILENGKFTLTEKTSVDIKFSGTNGQIKNICIKNDEASSFIETDDTALTVEGSYIRINLDNVAKILWAGTINDAPTFEDLTKPCPYAVVETTGKKLSMDDLNIEFGKEYDFEFTTADKNVKASIGKNHFGGYKMPFEDADKNKLTIFHNMNAVITKLVLVNNEGKETDVLQQKTFKRYVPEEINGPILMRNENYEPLDISAAYREVVNESCQIELFRGNYEMALSSIPVDHNIEVYGIPLGATLTTSATEIKEYASSYEAISQNYWRLDGKVLTVDNNVRSKYRGIAVRYQDCEKYDYIFTNYEREVFTDEARIILEKPIADNSGSIIVYGCKTEPDLDYLYRIPSELMINSIDICCAQYDLIPETRLEINYTDNEIKIDTELREKYPYLIIDYLKSNSYAVNYKAELSQYEVDISMDSTSGYLGYDMNDDGTIDTRKRTVITPNRNKFIILRRKTGEFD